MANNQSNEITFNNNGSHALLASKLSPAKPRASAAKTSEQLEKEINQLTQEHHKMQQEWQQLKQDEKLLYNEYALYNTCLNEVGSFVEASEQVLSQKIVELENCLPILTKEISGLIAGKDKESQQKIWQHQAIQFQIAALKQLFVFFKNQQKMVNSEGEESSFQDAAFILTPDLKIVKDDYGHYLLIDALQNQDDLTDNARSQAKKAFDELKPRLSTIKNAVKEHYEREKYAHDCRVQSAEKRGVTYDRILNLEAKVTLLHNQIAQIRAMQSHVAAEIKKPNADAEKIQKLHLTAPTFSNTAPVGKKIRSNRKMVEAALHNMINNPTQRTINSLRNQLTNIYGQNANQLVGMLGKILPGVQIPRTTMLFLLKSVHKLNSLNDKFEEQYSFNPSPFSNTLSPHKK